MASKATLLRSLKEKSTLAEQTLLCLRNQFEQLRRSAGTVLEEQLKSENAKLKDEVNKLRAELNEAEAKNGVKQVPLPSFLKSSVVAPSVKGSANDVVAEEKPVEKIQKSPEKIQQPQKGEKALKKQEKKQDAAKQPPKPQKAEKEDGKAGSEATYDVSKLNMKIGKIVAVDKHPDADSLYVERVDLGEGKERTIISGLVKHVPIEQMQGRLAVFLTNLKPAKMRGILSEGMIMCANSAEKVEIIEPPAGAEIGDMVVVEGFPGEPEEMLNPKKKIWESIAPDLKANEDGYATYKGALWKIEGKGNFKAPTVRNGQIK